jgi:hypothetical protein
MIGLWQSGDQGGMLCWREWASEVACCDRARYGAKWAAICTCCCISSTPTLVPGGAPGLPSHLEKAGGRFWPQHGDGSFLLYRMGPVGWSRRRVGDAQLPVKTDARLRSQRAMVASTCRYLVECIVGVACISSLVLFRWKPQSRYPG